MPEQTQPGRLTSVPVAGLRGVTKVYDETAALTDATLDFRAGEVHALMGENGSGKSTAVKILSGVVAPTEGTVVLDGQPIEHTSPRAAIDLGISTIHQDPPIVGSLTVAENVLLGRERTRRGFLCRGGNSEAARWLGEIGADIDPSMRASDLTIAGKQLVAIAKALSLNSRLLILDEPTASLGDQETQHLLEQVESLRDRGIGIVYISHRIKEVIRLADALTVLKDGHVVHTGRAGLDEREIVRLMIGREPGSLFPELRTPGDTEVLRLSDATSADGQVEVEDFRVRAGEVVGIAGLDGSGRSTLARMLGGVEAPAAGTLHVHGTELRKPDPRRSMRAGLAFVPPDRRRQGIVDTFSVGQSISQAGLHLVSRLGFIARRKERDSTRHWAGAMKVKTASLDQGILTLSGGNQQKVLLARALCANGSVLVFDEPTAGVDVGSRAEIYSELARLADGGLGIVLSSSDMVELMGATHRIVVVREGRISAELPAAEATEEGLLAAQLPHA